MIVKPEKMKPMSLRNIKKWKLIDQKDTKIVNQTINSEIINQQLTPRYY